MREMNGAACAAVGSGTAMPVDRIASSMPPSSSSAFWRVSSCCACAAPAAAAIAKATMRAAAVTGACAIVAVPVRVPYKSPRANPRWGGRKLFNVARARGPPCPSW